MRASVFMLLAIVFCSAVYGADVQPSPWRAMNGLSDRVLSLTVINGRLYVGGDRYAMLGPGSPASVAFWNGSVWLPVSDFMADRVMALGSYKGDLIAGCDSYTNGSTHDYDNVLRWTGSDWEPLGYFPARETEVDGMISVGDTLYVSSFSGNFKFDGTTWTQLPEYPHELAINFRLAEYNGKVYLGTLSGSSSGVNRVLRFTESGLEPVVGSDGITTPIEAYGVYSMLNAHGVLYVGGSMLLGGQPCAVAAWNGVDWSNVTFNLQGLGRSICLYHDTLIVGTGSGMWRLAGDRWVHIGITEAPVSFLTEYLGTLVAAGWFETVDGNARQCATQWFGCCAEMRGNVNYTGIVDLGDLSALVSYLTGGGYVLPCNEEADVNGMGIVDLSDLSSLVSYLTGGGYVLPNCL